MSNSLTARAMLLLICALVETSIFAGSADEGPLGFLGGAWDRKLAQSGLNFFLAEGGVIPRGVFFHKILEEVSAELEVWT